MRPISVRARSLGGGFAALDPTSALNPASVSRLTQLTVSAGSVADYRNYTAGSVAASGLRDTRFPLMLAGGPVPGTALTFAASFSGYTDRTFDVSSTDTTSLRGLPVIVTDRVSSDGGLGDGRAALAVALGRRAALGIGAHFISGSAKLAATREFSDSAFRPFAERRSVAFSGLGIAGGAYVQFGTILHLAGSARLDTRLTNRVDSVEVGQVELPLHVTGGMLFAPATGLRWATTATWRSWSDAQPGLDSIGGGIAFDSWEIGSGLELGGGASGSRLPLRLGFRYAQLPFSPTTDQPHEMVFSGGTGYPFAGFRGVIDLAVEHVRRSGAGVRERAWQLSVGLTVRP